MIGALSGIYLHAQPSGGAPGANPDTSLARHDFFYAGESKQERIFIVRKGRVEWSYTHSGEGEISDAQLLKSDRVLFAHQHGITEFDIRHRRVSWNYDAPPNTEIHTVEPYGEHQVAFVQNGNPAKLVVMNKVTGGIDQEFTLQVAHPDKIHPQFRRMRVTRTGTFLVAHMDMGKVVEYDRTGKQLWSVEAPGVWSAEPLADGNVLISGNNERYVREVNREAKIVWEFTLADAPGLDLTNMQTARRLKNGNTLITQWVNEWAGSIDKAAAPIQAIEVTPEKKVVWVLRSWTPPADLGPSTTIQILDK